MGEGRDLDSGKEVFKDFKEGVRDMFCGFVLISKRISSSAASPM